MLIQFEILLVNLTNPRPQKTYHLKLQLLT